MHRLGKFKLARIAVQVNKAAVLNIGKDNTAIVAQVGWHAAAACLGLPARQPSMMLKCEHCV
jgi:hypothetical protein